MSQSPKTPAKKPRNIIFRLLGPGLVTGAADDDPSGIATYSQAGAQFGSAAYGVAEAFGWPATLQAKAPDAVGFYGIIAAATIIGFGLGFTSINPIKMLIWSAVLNGIVAVPIMVVMMVIISKINLMGRFKAKSWLLEFGWGGTVLMAIAVIALVWSSLS
jgi:Mn2+/Fe2+ NRAMP family transporter